MKYNNLVQFTWLDHIKKLDGLLITVEIHLM